MKQSLATSWLRAAKRHVSAVRLRGRGAAMKLLSMTLSALATGFRIMKEHVRTNERYRWWPLYAAGLAGFLNVLMYWPVDRSYVMNMVQHPWMIVVNKTAWYGAVALPVLLALVGLMRASWLGRGLSLYALWFGYHYMTSTNIVLQQLWAEIRWWAYGSVGSDIHYFAGEGTPLAAVLWCSYVLVVWLVIRRPLRHVFPKVGRAEDWIVQRAPRVREVAKSWM